MRFLDPELDDAFRAVMERRWEAPVEEELGPLLTRSPEELLALQERLLRGLAAGEYSYDRPASPVESPEDADLEQEVRAMLAAMGLEGGGPVGLDDAVQSECDELREAEGVAAVHVRLRLICQDPDETGFEDLRHLLGAAPLAYRLATEAVMPGSALTFDVEARLSGDSVRTTSVWLPAGEGLPFWVLYDDLAPSRLLFDTTTAAKASALAALAGQPTGVGASEVFESEPFLLDRGWHPADGEVIHLGPGDVGAPNADVQRQMERFHRLELAPPRAKRGLSRARFWALIDAGDASVAERLGRIEAELRAWADRDVDRLAVTTTNLLAKLSDAQVRDGLEAVFGWLSEDALLDVQGAILLAGEAAYRAVLSSPADVASLAADPGDGETLLSVLSAALGERGVESTFPYPDDGGRAADQVLVTISTSRGPGGPEVCARQWARSERGIPALVELHRAAEAARLQGTGRTTDDLIETFIPHDDGSVQERLSRPRIAAIAPFAPATRRPDGAPPPS